mgnify:CR=1 FL=1
MEEYIRQIGLGNNVNFINHGSGKYELRHKEKNFGRPIARLRFELKNGELKITGGNTTHSYRSQGYGSTLRALATKAGQMLGAQRRRRRPDAHHRAWQSCRTQSLGGAHGTSAFLFGDVAQLVVAVEVVAGSRMRHHATQACAAVLKGVPDLQQQFVLWFDAGPMPVGVDLDPDLQLLLVLDTEG